MYFTYIMRCEDNSLYTGISTDVERRFREHKDRVGAKYTASRAVKEICAVWSSKNRSDASRLEYYIKTLEKGKKEALIKGQYVIGDLLPVDYELYERIK